MCDAISGFDQKSTLTVINVKMNDCCVYKNRLAIATRIDGNFEEPIRALHSGPSYYLN